MKTLRCFGEKRINQNSEFFPDKLLLIHLGQPCVFLAGLF